MGTSSRSVGRRTPKSQVAARSHRGLDIGGIICITLGIVVLIALAVGGAGAVGEALTGFFQMLFGKAAWVVPFALILAGGTMMAGGKDVEVNRITWGILLLFLAIVGFMAQARDADYFDPDTVAQSGGYVGACVAWVFEFAIGRAKSVGIGALGMSGLVLCLNVPLRMLIRKPTLGRSGGASPMKAVIERSLSRGSDPITERREQMEERKAKLRESLLHDDGPIHVDERGIDQETRVPGNPPKKTSLWKDRRTTSLNTQMMPDARQESLIVAQPTPKEGYNLPAMTLLKEPSSRPRRSADEMQRNIVTLERTLEEFNIDANVVEVATGPTITRYEIQLGPGIRVGRITALADNIAMNLAASHVRVEAPIPGKAAIGVEVPNAQPSMVTLREVCSMREFTEHPSRLCVALGQDVSGVNRYADLTKMPHLLIGGATNSGKSIGLATIITSLLMRNTPKDLKMVMIDPKRVELSLFDGIPHLMCPVVKDVKEAPGVLRAVWREMDIRYDRMSERGVRNIDGWNEKASFAEKMPYIVVIIDELADLMIQAAAEVETSICRLAQLARAVGIHLVIATQRPSVDVISGTIKANIASRVAFAVSSQIDSRTILDQSGAERLVGRGDMLFLPIDASKPLRIQGCYVSEREIESVCNHWKAQEKPQYVLNPIDLAAKEKREQGDNEATDDPLWEDTVRWVAEKGQASTSMLQRRFSIGFQRASRLLDMMEERGIVGPRDGPRPRELLMDIMQVESMLAGKMIYDGPDLGFMDDE